MKDTKWQSKLTLWPFRRGIPEQSSPLVDCVRVAERWLGRPAKAVELTEGLTDDLSKMFYLNQLSAFIYFRGLSLAEIGRIEDAISALNHGIDLCEKLGGPIHLGRLYNTLGYCYGEIHHPEEAWKWNLKSEGIARKLMEQYPMRGLIAGRDRCPGQCQPDGESVRPRENGRSMEPYKTF